MRRPAIQIIPPVLSSFCFYGALLVTLAVLQSSLVFMPRRDGEGTPADVGLAYDTVALVTRDGLGLSAWLVRGSAAAGGTPRVVLFCHGNAGNLSDRLGRLRVLHDLGLSVLAFDYRGYGMSDGSPSESGLLMDAESAWDYLVSPAAGFRPEEIVVHGHSLGGAIAARLARGREPAALILESAFTSAPDLAAGFLPLFPVTRLLRYRFDTRRHVRSVGCPVLVVHSPEDGIVPFSHGRRLFEAAPEPKKFLEIRGAHNSGFLESARSYREGLQSFLSLVRRSGRREDTAPP